MTVFEYLQSCRKEDLHALLGGLIGIGFDDDDRNDALMRWLDGDKVDSFHFCEDCEYMSDDGQDVCCNGNSQHCADFVCRKGSCDEWVKKERTV